MYRTHTCGELRLENAGQRVTLAGWVQRVRKMGGMSFIDLRDRYGITQIIIDESVSRELNEQVEKLGREYVIQITGTVQERQSKNARMDTGDVEVRLESLNVLNAAATPPFTIEDESDGGDDLRMKYRYLDLRRNPLKKNLMLRHRMAHEIRNYLDGQGFMEIETPYLIKSTPEGARDFVVPSRMNPGQFYALPQSPQQQKQLLMVAGYDRYFQIVRCFRDEDLRADRQPEFTQIDCEMSFVERDDVLETFEGMIKTLFHNVLGKDFTEPFYRMPYSEAMDSYGSDKPDIRFGMKLHEITSLAQGHGFPVFDSAEYVGGIAVPGCAGYSRKQTDELTEWVKRPQIGAKGLVYIKCNEDGTFKSSADKFLIPDDLAAMAAAVEAQKGDLIMILAGARNRMRTARVTVWACATRRCSPPCGWWTSPCWSGTRRPPVSMPCTILSPLPNPSIWNGSTATARRIWSASAPMPTTSCSTAPRWAAAPSVSTIPKCRSVCSRSSVSAVRMRITASAS